MYGEGGDCHWTRQRKRARQKKKVMNYFCQVALILPYRLTGDKTANYLPQKVTYLCRAGGEPRGGGGK